MDQNVIIPNDADKHLFAEDCMNFMMQEINKAKYLGLYGIYRKYLCNTLNEFVETAFQFLIIKIRAHLAKTPYLIRKVNLNLGTFKNFAKDLADSYFSEGFQAYTLLHFCVTLTAFAMFFYNNGVTKATELTVSHIYNAFKEHHVTKGGWSTLNSTAEHYVCKEALKTSTSVESLKNYSNSSVKCICKKYSWKGELSCKLNSVVERYFEIDRRGPLNFEPIVEDSNDMNSPENLHLYEVPENSVQKADENTENMFNENDELNTNENGAEEGYQEIFDRFTERFAHSPRDTMNIKWAKCLIVDKVPENTFVQNSENNQDCLYDGNCCSNGGYEVMQNELALGEDVSNLLVEYTFAENTIKNQNNMDNSKCHLNHSLTEVIQNYFATNEKVENPLEFPEYFNYGEVPEHHFAQTSVQDNVGSGTSYLTENVKVTNPVISSMTKEEIFYDEECIILSLNPKIRQQITTSTLSMSKTKSSNKLCTE